MKNDRRKQGLIAKLFISEQNQNKELLDHMQILGSEKRTDDSLQGFLMQPFY